MRIPVQVTGAGRRLARPRPVAERRAYPAPPATTGIARVARHWLAAALQPAPSRPGLRAANARPLSPERLFDSRDGTGVPGAVIGPLEAGQEVRLAVAGQRGIPDTAAGVAVMLSITDADYNGYITLRPAGTVATTVASHFSQGGETKTSSVVIGLGSGTDHGALSVIPTDNWPGHLQITIEANAYLEGPASR